MFLLRSFDRRVVIACFVGLAVVGAACSPPSVAGQSIPAGNDTKTPSTKTPTKKDPSNTPEPTTTPAPASSSAPPPTAPATNNTPTLTSIAPDSAAIGSSPNGVDIALTGTKFISGAQVDVNGTKLAATFDSATSIHVKIPADHLTTAGSIKIAVAQTGIESNTLSFTVANPTNVTITDLNPKSVVLGANQAVTLNVTGTGFTQQSVIRFNGAQLQTTFTSATALSGAVPASTFIDAGKFSVTVATGADVVSLPSPFEVQNPLPAITTLAPKSIAAQSGATVVTITGTGFSKGSTVLSGATALTTTFVSGTSLRATVPASLITTEGSSLNLTVQNGTPGGGTSSAQAITFTAAVASTGGTGTSGGTNTSGGTSTGTGAGTSSSLDCAYTCVDYNYSPGQCFQGYYCIESGTYAGCLGTADCDAINGTTSTGTDTGTGTSTGTGTGTGTDPNTCQYACADYNYSPGDCSGDFYCDPDTDCLVDAICP